jgi:hypothetical protein
MLPGLTKAKPDRLSTSQLVFCQQTRFSRSCVSSRDGTAFHLPDFRLMPFISAFPRAFVRSSTGLQILRVIQSLDRHARRLQSRLAPSPQHPRYPSTSHPSLKLGRTSGSHRLSASLCADDVICTDDAVLLALRLRRLATVKRTANIRVKKTYKASADHLPEVVLSVDRKMRCRSCDAGGPR